MKPVIELRDRSVTVLPAFDGSIEGSRATTRANLVGNRLRYVVDSAGNLWTFTFTGTNRQGLRKLVSSLLWNVSSDIYRVDVEPATVSRFREVLAPYLHAIDDDDRELAAALLEPVAQVEGSAPLDHYVERLNL